MQQETTPLNRAVSGALPAALALLFACAQATAATSEILCDRLSPRTVSLEVPKIEFEVEVAEHGIDSNLELPEGALTAKSDTQFLPALAPNRIELAPLASAILKQVFDESAARQFDLDEDSNPVRRISDDTVRVAPDQPAADASDPDVTDADSVEDEALPAEAETRFPGLADEHALRYREQMFRTDI